MAGVTGAMFNSALQIGSAVGIAAVTSISTNIEKKDGPDGFREFKGRKDGFWFVIAVIGAGILSVLAFYKPERCTVVQSEELGDAVDQDGDLSVTASNEVVGRCRVSG